MIKEKWPVLFHEFYGKFHFHFLTAQKPEIFDQNSKDNVLKLLIFKHSKASIFIDDGQRWDAVNILFKQFNEKSSDLLTLNEVRTRRST